MEVKKMDAQVRTPGGQVTGIENAIAMLGANAPAWNVQKALVKLYDVKYGTQGAAGSGAVSEQVA